MSEVASAPRRALALDALRGVAIFGMILSARIPYSENWLPGWMYHGQEGPNPQWFGPHPAGFTWVDLVFPAFLFALGAAIPLALSRRLDRGISTQKVMLGTLQRFGLLAFFAIYLQNTLPNVIGTDGTDRGWWLAFVSFLILFPIFWRLPRAWSQGLQIGVRAAGWIAAIGMLWYLHRAEPLMTVLGRRDIIILVLANMALFATPIWLWTRGNLPARLAIMVIIGALGHASMGGENHITLGLADALAPLNATPIAWLWQLLFLKYLFVVIPGTIVGDILLAWMNSEPEAEPTTWPRTRLAWLGLLAFGLTAFAHVGLKARWPVATPIVLGACCLAGLALVRMPKTSTEQLLACLWRWAMVWLAIGMMFEPFEGGIKKTPSTMSYYLVSTGLSIFLVIAFTVVIDVFRRRWWLGIMITNGQNPMIAYAGIRGVLGPFYALTRIDAVITAPIFAWGAWAGAAWGTLKSLSLACLVHLLTRLRVFWRS